MGIINVQNDRALLTLNSSIYSESVIFNACRPFMKNFDVNVKKKGKRFLVELKPRQKCNLKDASYAFFDSLLCEMNA